MLQLTRGDNEADDNDNESDEKDENEDNLDCIIAAYKGRPGNA